MGKGKKFLSLFLAAAMAVTGISVGAPVTAEAAETKAAQEATVDLVLEHFEGSGGQSETAQSKVIISAKSGEDAAGTAHNAAFVQGEETEEGTTFVSNNNPSYFTSGGRVAAVQFKIADGLTEESIGEAVLKIKFSEVGNLGGDGKMRLGVFETDAQEFAVAADNNAACTEGDKSFPAVGNDYTYGATMWSNFIQQSGNEQTAEVDVTRAVKNAVKKNQTSVVLRLQVPTGGGRMLGVMAANASSVPQNAPTLTVTRTAPVVIKYVAVSGDDAKEIKTAKQEYVTIGKEYAYEVPDSEKIVTASDGTGIVTYEYVASDPDKITVTADDGTAAKNLIILKYKEKLADKAALVAKINEVKDYVQANYTPETWASFKEALDKASQVAASKYVTDTEVADALDELTAAADSLQLSDTGKLQPATDADKTALTSYITDFESRVTSIAEYEVAYPEAARTAFDEAVAQVKAKTITTLKDIEDAKNELKAAEAALKAAYVTPYDGKAADIQALDEQIQAAEGLLTDDNKAKNEDAYNTLKTAKETAEQAKSTALTTVVTKEQVTGATEALKSAIAAFKAAIAETVVEITGVSLDKTTLSVAEGQTAKLAATIIPAHATTDKTLIWMSDKQDIAKVGQDGTVTGVKAGTAKVTVTTKNGKTATCTVTVTAKGSGSGTETTDVKVSLDKEAVTLAAGKNIILKATVSPIGAGTVTWASSDSKVATVVNGRVTAKKAGTAKITAAVGKKTATCTVTVVSLSKTKLTLGVKEKLTLKVNGTNKKVTWTSSNKKTATVTNGKVTAKKANKKAITITATVDGVSLTCKVTVKAAPKKLILKGKKTITVKKKKTVKLKVSLPKNTAGTLKYKTSNKKVATVDTKGKVKGIKKGTAKITVTAANNKKAKVVVTVKVK